ncbi:PilZ domain-containing protein [Sphingomonas sp. VNH70]|uniref:PilZ domain-containing protein n=1 Tax=Sphingomonas silueang TaxID=3156617 RepID=UPI0032B379F4
MPDSVPARERRSSVILRALVETGTDAVECRVRNLSASGVCIDNDAALAPGARVLVSMGLHHRMRGEVMWTDDRFAGVRIDGGRIDIDSARRPRGTIATLSPTVAGWLAQIDDPYHRRQR